MKLRYGSIIAALAFAALVARPAMVPADPLPVTPEVPVTTGTPASPTPTPSATPAPSPTPAPSVTAPPAAPAVPEGPVVPEPLKPPAGQRLSLETVAIGVQIYECKPAKDDPKRFEWVFKAPEAELFDSAGKRIGRHYAGPTWEANDGSKVVGEIKGRDDGPDPGAIPWLLLSAKSTAGNGIFSRVLSIQRLHTVGGKAPAVGCDRAQAGNETRVAYEAGYYFYTAGP